MKLQLPDKTDLIITCRKLNALTIAERVSFPYDFEEKRVDREHLGNFPFRLLRTIAVEPSKLETLSFTQLQALVATDDFQTYFMEMFGEIIPLTEESEKNA